jgi:hypothetical protein
MIRRLSGAWAGGLPRFETHLFRQIRNGFSIYQKNPSKPIRTAGLRAWFSEIISTYENMRDDGGIFAKKACQTAQLKY